MYSLDIREIPSEPNYAATRGGLILRIATQSGRLSMRPLHPAHADTGHASVRPCRNGESHKRYVHHLVLETWVGPRPDGHEADHLNFTPNDNRTNNLEWVTPKENKRRYAASDLCRLRIDSYLRSAQYQEHLRLNLANQQRYGCHTPKIKWAA